MAPDPFGRSESLAQSSARLQRGLRSGARFNGQHTSFITSSSRRSSPEASGESLGKMEKNFSANKRQRSLERLVVSSASTTRSKRMNSNKIVTKLNLVELISTQKPTTSRIHSSKLAFLSLVTFMTILILLTCLTNQRVSSLNCITCSSADNPGCDETYSANISDTSCEPHIGKPAKVCRKIVQYVESKKVVIRSCGWIDEHEDKKPMCYKRSGTFALMMESCICYEDNCNHSASLVPNQSVLISLACGSTILLCLMAGRARREAR